MNDDNIKLLTAHPYLSKNNENLKIMLAAIIALVPMLAFAIFKYRLNAVIHIAITVIVCVCTDYLYKYFIKKDVKGLELDSVVTGIVIALLLPAYAPYWVGVLGGVFAVLIIKNIFGGIGNCIVNPACAAICFLNIALPRYMDNYVVNGNADIAFISLKNNKTVDTFKLMIGNTDGAMGEICAVALLIGAVILVLAGIVDIYIPAVYIITFSVIVSIVSGNGFDLTYLTSQLASGGLLFVVWFMAANFISSPITTKGQIVYGALLGVFTALVRLYGSNTFDIYFVLLFVNMCVPLIENLTIPKPFSKGGALDVKR